MQAQLQYSICCIQKGTRIPIKYLMCLGQFKWFLNYENQIQCVLNNMVTLVVPFAGIYKILLHDVN